MANHLRTELVLDALEMAVGQRRPHDVIHHSDQGSQYTSLAFGGRCREVGVRPSMGSVGDAYDNAMCESFFSTLECELLARRKFAAPGRSQDRLLQLHRRLLQSSAVALRHRISVTHLLRVEDRPRTCRDSIAAQAIQPSTKAGQSQSHFCVAVRALTLPPGPRRGCPCISPSWPGHVRSQVKSKKAQPDWIRPCSSSNEQGSAGSPRSRTGRRVG